MTKQDLQNKKTKILKCVNSHRLHNVFSELKAMASELNSWEIDEKIKQLEDSYLMMLKYAINGVEDPSRGEVYNNIVAHIYILLDEITRECHKKSQSANIYFSTLRYQEMQRNGSITQMIDRYNNICDNSSLFNLISEGQSNDKAMSRDLMLERENLEIKIFNKIWTTYPLSSEDVTSIENSLFSETLPTHFKHLVISAIFLGLMSYYENSRMQLLLSIYQRGDGAMSIKALCATLISMYLHRERLIDKKLLSQLESVKEMPSWHKDVRMVYMQIIRSRDTERINRKMQEELLPEMMKLRPDIYNKINNANTNISDITSMEENPEWQEILENSGIAEKMKELTEMQEEGSDVFMSTFAHLKSYPFFSQVSNWFLPFHIEHSEVSRAIGEKDNVIGDLISASPFLCNSDKFSFALSLQSIPESQRTMMMSQLNAQNLNMAEIRSAELLASDKARENIANKYIQDLYRFFKLFRSKNDFVDPFGLSINLTKIPILSDDFNDNETLSLIGEFYFKRKYYSDALEIFEILSKQTPPSAQLFQKMGYVLQQNGDISGALKYYEQSELLNSDNLWTLRRIAICHKMLGNSSEALNYYKRIELSKPDDANIALNIGNCLLEMELYDEALKYFYKSEFLDEKSIKAWRPIAWCSLLTKNFNQSLSYYKKIVENNPESADYLNMGHVELALGNYEQSVSNYKRSIALSSGNTEQFITSINNDIKYLGKIGINSEIIPLIIDFVLYSM